MRVLEQILLIQLHVLILLIIQKLINILSVEGGGALPAHLARQEGQGHITGSAGYAHQHN